MHTPTKPKAAPRGPHVAPGAAFISRSCAACGNEIRDYAERRAGELAFCNRLCRRAWNIRGGHTVEVECARCGTKFDKGAARMTNSAGQELARHYCNKACWSARALPLPATD